MADKRTPKKPKRSNRQIAVAAAAAAAVAAQKKAREAAKIQSAAQQKVANKKNATPENGGNNLPPDPVGQDVDSRLQKLETAMDSVDKLREQMVTLTGVLAAAAAPADISEDESVEEAPHATQTTGSFPAVPPPTEYPVGPLPGRAAHTTQSWLYGPAPYVPHPREMAMDPVTRRYIQEQAEMAMPNFVAAPPKGNILLDMRIKRFIPRPHMYIDQEGCVTIKEKLDYRNKMSYQQYMCAFTTNSAGPDPGPPGRQSAPD